MADIKKGLLGMLYSGIMGVTTGDPMAYYKMQIAEEQRKQQEREAKMREAIDIANLTKASWSPGFQQVTLPTGQQLSIPTGQTLYKQAMGEKVAEEKREFNIWKLKADTEFEQRKKLEQIQFNYNVKLRDLPKAPQTPKQYEVKANQVNRFLTEYQRLKDSKDSTGLMQFLSNTMTKRIMQDNNIVLDESELGDISGLSKDTGYINFMKNLIKFQVSAPAFKTIKDKEKYYKDLYKSYGLEKGWF
jgi:hypothetical protein